ncbi:hypothetical protein JYK00_00685 [Thermosipho ferrireducens]|uniref:Uncharacterized protein n=1 Tax=Thermosipho ferrireducens TaxID=2571116 RepID=A0ABX7S691_9BACT|nr:hypothetical protein [Thermosipho ferrireducens]QTA38097.1 hypothetical protein JYK00_00685 [Thermosipho ferrireducens]
MKKFYLVLLTIFAFLFLITFYNMTAAKKQIQQYQVLVKAYEMYINKNANFESFVKENNIKELEYLLNNNNRK